MKLKRTIAAVLTAVMLLGIMSFSAYAANWGEGDTLEDALSQLKVGFDDTLLDWLVLPTLGTIYLRYTYFQYKNERTGTIDKQPVYCIDPTKGGAYEIVAALGANNDGSQTATYIRGEKVGDAKYKAILSAGYPHMRLTSLGLETIEEGYYATKLALWMYIRGNDPSKLTINPKYGNDDPVALRVLAAAVEIYTNGTTGSGVKEPSLTLTGKPSATATLNANGEYYVQGVEVVASGWVGTNPDACGDVQLSWDSPPPADTIVLGSSGEDITSAMNVTMTTGSSGWTGKVTIKYPASEIDAETFSPPTLLAKAIVPNDGIYVAYAEAGKDTYQRYLVESDPKIELTASFVSQLNYEPGIVDFPTDTGLRIRKVETGTNTPLEGAVFEIRDPDGKLIYSMATDASGIIDIPLYVTGNYTVTETSPPQYHLLSENRTQSVSVRYGEVAEVTFTNAPYGTLRVVKRDVANGMPLGGAAVKIRNITTNATQEGYTDSSGCIVFNNLPVGAYEIVEITSPDGYALDSTVHTVNVVPLSEGETSYTLTNKANPGLRITKFDRQTMTPIAGVTFEIWHDGELYGTYVTDAWGEIVLYNLPAGTYTAREVATIEPYVLDTTAQWIELKAGQGYISELVFFNLTKPGIHLTKVDSETLAPLPNARFLISQVGGSFSKEYTTDENGEIDLTGLDPGAYQVIEQAAPDGYLTDDAVRTIQINAGENAQFVFTNTKKPSLEIVKYDPVADKYLGGATFRIARIEDGSNYLDRITDTNGRITIDGLEPGIYSVQEIAAPSGYVLNDTEYHVKLFPSKTSQLVVVNEAKPNLKIVKTDAITGAPVAGVTFTVNIVDGSTLTTVTTDANGEALMEGLDPGVYTVTEKSVPDGYLLDETPQNITLVPNKTGVVQFKNYPKPALTINKVDSVTSDPIKGVKFQVWYASNNTFTGEINDLGTYYTDENGQINLTGLKDGWYRIKELGPAAGYAIKDPDTQDIYLEAGRSKTVTFENTPLNAIVIKKVDADTGEVLQGAKFELRYLSGVSGTGGTIIGSYTTSSNGTVVITGLKAGTYVVEEIEAPDGYEITEGAKTVYLTENEQTTVSVEFADKKHSGLVIKKIDSVTGAALSGAVFKITDSSGAVVGTANGEYTTDAYGLIQIGGLAAGTYLVTEIKAPSGYVLSSETKSIYVKNDGKAYSLTFENTPQGGLQIKKTDEETGKVISGVTFEIRKMNGEIIGSYTTDSNGMIRLPGLDAGWYTITETKAAKGYLLDSTAYNVEVKEGQTKVLTVTNRQASSVLIHKVDANTGKGIYGVTFLLYDAKMNPIGRYTSDQSGYVYVDKTLEDGKYYAQEIEAADGYILDNTIKTFYIEYGATSTITWKNTPVTAQIQIVKYSSDYNSVTGTPAGSLLKGAVFEISQARSGTVVGYITTDARGVAASEPLPLGRYIIKEVTAPQYYQLSSETFDVTLEYSGQIIRLSAYNKSANLGTEIKKVGNVEIIAGDSMRYDISVGNTSNVPLSNFYWTDRLPTDAASAQTLTTGTYNQRLYYRVLYKTNYSEWRVLASNLLSTNNYSFNLSAAALGLMSGEAVTNIKLEFGTVAAGFASVTKPTITVQTFSTLANGYQITNRCEVGGHYQGAWQTSTGAWVTKVVRYGATPSTPSLPKTGF